MSKESTPPPSSSPLLSGIRTLVSQTNATLAALQRSTLESSHYLTSCLVALSHQGRLVASRAISAYDHRGYYGPQICVASAVLLGSVAGMRAGRVAGGVAAGCGGLVAYDFVYGLDRGSVAEGWRDRIKRVGS